ncbi:hypothetical protein HNY73_009686 [Argiope bruennichi]|uniref:Uncharacterized protein n=1 Tax=Argiope bruennichi TaxID=94029 RepID=A0A8T0FH06_ARGBR|nr:hypothetical protein HNY73_009686 [Argiope bruennichi]
MSIRLRANSCTLSKRSCSSWTYSSEKKAHQEGAQTGDHRADGVHDREHLVRSESSGFIDGTSIGKQEHRKCSDPSLVDSWKRG